MLACSFLIESSSKLVVTRTGIKARSSSILGRIRQLILELLALEWWKFHTFELEYLWSQLASPDQSLCVASLGWGKGCIRFWGRLTLAHWTQGSDRCPLGYLLVGPFVHFLTSCVRTAKALVRLRRLAWAFAGRLCNKYHNLMTWLIYVTCDCQRPCSFKYLILPFLRTSCHRHTFWQS